MRPGAAAGVGAALLAMTGCGSSGLRPAPLDPSYQPRMLGSGPRYRPPASGQAAARALAVTAGSGRVLRCSPATVSRFGVHLELFAAGRVVAIPAGIGMAPPQTRRGAYVLGARCSYPMRTLEPTGLIQVRSGARVTLGDFFSVWGQTLSPRRLAGFATSARAPVRGYVNGQRWSGDLRLIPLSRHAQIVLEIGSFVPPHPAYRFPPGI